MSCLLQKQPRALRIRPAWHMLIRNTKLPAIYHNWRGDLLLFLATLICDSSVCLVCHKQTSPASRVGVAVRGQRCSCYKLIIICAPFILRAAGRRRRQQQQQTASSRALQMRDEWPRKLARLGSRMNDTHWMDGFVSNRWIALARSSSSQQQQQQQRNPTDLFSSVRSFFCWLFFYLFSGRRCANLAICLSILCLACCGHLPTLSLPLPLPLPHACSVWALSDQ